MNFLFSKTNREFIVFLFFLALSGVFWLMMQLNETKEKEVHIAVRYVNVRKNAVLTSGETDTLRVTVTDKGFNIISYLYGQTHRPLEIDFARYANNDGTGTVGSSDIKKMVAEDLPASSKVISIKPDKLQFYYNNGESKRVPVLFKGTVNPQALYFVAEREIMPDSVTVYASRTKLDSISAVYTEEHTYNNVHDTLLVTAQLAAIPGTKTLPDEVNVRFVTDVLAEVSMKDLPIEGINMPEGRVLRTFPARVSVRFVTGMKKYQSLKAEDFRIVADYNEFSQDPSTKCNIYLEEMPDGITNPRLEVTQVDYLIEGK